MNGVKLLLGRVAVFMGLSIGSFQAWSDIPAAIAPPALTSPAQPNFRPDDDGEAHRFIVAVTFLIMLAIGGFITVRYGKRQFPLRLRTTDVQGGIRLLSLRRITPRLTLVKVLLDDNSTVVIADNGTHLLLVSERTESTHVSISGKVDAR